MTNALRIFRARLAGGDEGEGLEFEVVGGDLAVATTLRGTTHRFVIDHFDALDLTALARSRLVRSRRSRLARRTPLRVIGESPDQPAA